MNTWNNLHDIRNVIIFFSIIISIQLTRSIESKIRDSTRKYKINLITIHNIIWLRDISLTEIYKLKINYLGKQSFIKIHTKHINKCYLHNYTYYIYELLENNTNKSSWNFKNKIDLTIKKVIIHTFIYKQL